MKANFFLIIILALSFLIGVGCASFSWGGGADPKLGNYDYTHRTIYQGSPKRVIHIWIDANYTQRDHESIKKAIDSWNFALNGYIKLEVVDDDFDMEIPKIVQQVKENGWLFMKLNSDSTIIPVPDKAGNQTIGFTERIGGNHMYIIRDRIVDYDVYGIALHEMGHMLGSEHVGDHLMYPTYGRARFQCIDFETIKAVAKFQEIPVESLNFCVDKGEPIPVEVDAGPGKTIGLEL